MVRVAERREGVHEFGDCGLDAHAACGDGAGFEELAAILVEAEVDEAGGLGGDESVDAGVDQRADERGNGGGAAGDGAGAECRENNAFQSGIAVKHSFEHFGAQAGCNVDDDDGRLKVGFANKG